MSFWRRFGVAEAPLQASSALRCHDAAWKRTEMLVLHHSPTGNSVQAMEEDCDTVQASFSSRLRVIQAPFSDIPDVIEAPMRRTIFERCCRLPSDAITVSFR